MGLLFKVMTFYLFFAVLAVYLVWRLIGREGFEGLENTGSPLAKLFHRRIRRIVA